VVRSAAFPGRRKNQASKKIMAASILQKDLLNASEMVKSEILCNNKAFFCMKGDNYRSSFSIIIAVS
jgi:hypothetical protein